MVPGASLCREEERGVACACRKRWSSVARWHEDSCGIKQARIIIDESCKVGQSDNASARFSELAMLCIAGVIHELP